MLAKSLVAAVIVFPLIPCQGLAGTVSLWDGKSVASVVSDGSITGKLAASMLAHDLKSLSGQDIHTSSSLTSCARICVVIGLYNSPSIANLAHQAGIEPEVLKGGWERYGRATLTRNGKTYVLIVGSDRRGMVYGVVDLTRELGISAWEWWADVTPRRSDRVSISGESTISDPPAVKYRGIFINDEDWGLQPWAAKTFDPTLGDIGPKTYARVYELLWRLKANTLWPAMHDVTSPFYRDLNNPKLASNYAVVVGTSHAEPMMRNNTREWDEKTMGRFNFLTNRQRMITYWRTRAEQSKPFENIYSIGLRGTGDGPMEGADTPAARRDVLNDVQGVERGILSKALRKSATDIPQAFTVYKEVEGAYNAGLKLPEDITLVWCDDNYGYLTRLSAPAEQKRSGGSGVYYHISYWGRPHDYLWLATTHPSLIKEQMGRAWTENARKEWILNVGDIKPGEYLTQYFMDLAFDHAVFDQAPDQHLRDFMTRQFGSEQAPEITAIMMSYYDLAFERKPEFMGWDQTEPITPTHTSEYVQSGGEEAQKRLMAYDELVRRAENVAGAIPIDRQAAFFELVLYPVRSAANLNRRVLRLDLSTLYAHQGRASANFYSDRAKDAQAQIVKDTSEYNALLNGKWRFMMDMAPRRLPIFDPVSYPIWSDAGKTGCGVSFSGQYASDSPVLTFRKGQPGTQIITLFSYAQMPAMWNAQSSNRGLILASNAGELTSKNGYEVRMSVDYDGGDSAGNLALNCGDKTFVVKTQILAASAIPAEKYRAIVVPASSAQLSPQWEVIDELGSLGQVVRSKLDLTSLEFSDAINAAPIVYRFKSLSAVGGHLSIILLPTRPLHPGLGVRIAASLDNGPLQLLDFSTLGRSDEWRSNVLSNTASRAIPLPLLPPGDHELKVYALDPGVVIDRIEVDLDGAAKHYSVFKEAM